MEILIPLIVLLALVGAALMAGVFFIFSTTVMRALSQLPVGEGIRAMQAINRVILNPWFLGSFVGTAVLSMAVILLALLRWGGPGTPSLLAAAGLYLFGTFLLTGVKNVPLNNRLETVGTDEAATFWSFYLHHWTRYNHYRTVASLLSVVLYALGLREL